MVVILYYYAYPMWAGLGLRSHFTDSLMLTLYRSGSFRNQYAVRGVCLFFCAIAVVVRSGRSQNAPWVSIIVPLGMGLILFFTAPLMGNRWVFVLATFTGFVLFFIGALRLGRKYRSFDASLPDYWDTFQQCEVLMENKYSINIPLKYQFEGKLRRGYINVVNPFRGSMVIGTPGSGKSYSIYGPFIRQMIQKGYAMFVYDYKFPDLTTRVMNELLDNYDCYKGVKPKMYVVNFDNPLYSHRFNPIHPRYLQDPIDATEIAEVILKNANRENAKGEDFFSMSARCYIDLLIWFLKIYKKGIYCTFPHLIELMGQDYRNVLDVLQKFKELDVKRTTFADAMKDSLAVDLFFMGSGSVRKKHMGPIVTLQDFTECYPYDGKSYGVKLTGAQLKKALLHIYRDAAWLGNHTEFYQLSKGMHVIYSKSRHELLKCELNGDEVRDDLIYNVGIQEFHYNNLPEFFNLSYEEVKANGEPMILTTSDVQTLLEYFKNNKHLGFDVEGRLEVVD